MAQFSLSWDLYKQNICNGLCTLQQNGEFVDMTLAADGHHVKVHQLVMSLVSPYIKELISSAQCPHPVIFLNKVSYPVLCSILEYVYTGEVLIMRDDLPDLIEAAKQLHIKGLEETQIDLSTIPYGQDVQTSKRNILLEHSSTTPLASPSRDNSPVQSPEFIEADESFWMNSENENEPDKNNEQSYEPIDSDKRSIKKEKGTKKKDKLSSNNNENNVIQLPSDSGVRVHYSISSHGSLQAILNRYLYYLRYTSRFATGGRAGRRMWRCAEYVNKFKCPAALVTKDDIVMKRFGKHNHPYPDKQILKKVQKRRIFATLNETEMAAERVRKERTK